MVFIVGEIGVNWDGDFDLLKKMMINAKNAGCDAVKFQAYNEIMIKDHPDKVRLMKSAITKYNVNKINELANSIGIEWFCTPMYPEAVDFLEPFVKRFKVRVYDGKPLLENKTTVLLEKILKTKKDILVSCEKSPKNTKYYNNSNIKWLYCVPKYPCDLSELDFRILDDFDGFSNHCPSIIAPLTAAVLGIEIIEVHITSDKSQDFIDNNVSFDFTELNELVKMIRQYEKIIT